MRRAHRLYGCAGAGPVLRRADDLFREPAMAEGPIASTAVPVPVGCSWRADDLFRESADGGGRRHLSDRSGTGRVRR